MDKFWSIFCVPLGIVICFGPALIAWIRAERKSGPNPSSPNANRPSNAH
jgi:hypothetical protein